MGKAGTYEPDCGVDGWTGATDSTNDLWHWEFDSQDIADSLPFTHQEYADAATALDGGALASDIAAEAFVVTLTAVGALGASVEGTPVAGPAGAYVGYWTTQIAVRPVMVMGNILATLATVATTVSEAKTGTNRLQLEASIGQDGLTVDANLSVGPSTQIAATLTGLGWIAPLTDLLPLANKLE